MSEQSKYFDYLPSCLWEQDLPTDFSVGSMLRIFEKVLTGIDDGVEIRHGLHVHDPVSSLIDRLDQLFDPWRVPEQFLPWLASWVALEFPTSQGQPLWDEHQRRKVTSEIAKIYRKRGVKEGLNQHLQLLALGNTRPRISIDDGSRLLVTSPRPGRLAPMAAFVTQGPVIGTTQDNKTVVMSEGLIRPWCIAVAPDGSLFIGDRGVVSGTNPPRPFDTIKNRVWRISATGQYDMGDAPPRPQPLARDTLFEEPRAVAVRQQRPGQPEALYVLLDRNGQLYRLPAPYIEAQATEVVRAGTKALWPVAMAIDTTGDLLILDRGSTPGTPSAPRIITVPVDTVPVDPSKITRRTLNQVIEPLSLLVQPNGQLIIGDGREQEPTNPDQFSGNLVLVDRSNPSAWNEKLLLPTANPLVAPTAIARTDDTDIYVLDVGLKPFLPTEDPFILKVAEPAVVFRVNLSADPSVTRVTDIGQLVFPTGMVANGGQLFVCDPGYYHQFTGLLSVWCRLLPFRFSAMVHFAESRLPANDDERGSVQEQIFGKVRDLVGQHKPAHTHWDVVRLGRA